MLGLLQKLLKGGSLILIGIIFGVAIGGVKPSAPVSSQQVSPSPLPITSDVQGVATQAPIIASPSASIEPIPSVKPTPTPRPTKKPTIAPTPRQTPKPTSIPVTQSDSGLSNNNTYLNSAGNEVHSPAYSNSVPAGATAVCGDGTYSFSQSRSGTCSHHGGVSQWL